jgi:hypothetical protein
MARIELLRHAEADPAGVALLLSGPVGRELWPGATARFGAPVRSGVGFVVEVSAEVDAADEGGLMALGHVGITPGDSGPGASDLRLVLRAPGPATARLATDADRFLEALADAAQERSSAA